MKVLISSVALLVLICMTAVGCQQATTTQGTEGRSLTLVLPRSITLHRGETQMMTVGLTRNRINEGVSVSISNLPSGVSAKAASKTIETDATSFELKADATADLVTNHAVTVTARGPDQIQVVEQFQLTVKQ